MFPMTANLTSRHKDSLDVKSCTHLQLRPHCRIYHSVSAEVRGDKTHCAENGRGPKITVSQARWCAFSPACEPHDPRYWMLRSGCVQDARGFLVVPHEATRLLRTSGFVSIRFHRGRVPHKWRTVMKNFRLTFQSAFIAVVCLTVLS